MRIFPDAGPQHTEETLVIARNIAVERGVPHVIVASTVGDTAVKAVEVFGAESSRLIIVTHNCGFSKPGVQEFSPDARNKVIEAGGRILTGTHILRGLGAAIRGKDGFSDEQLVAAVLRMFSEGVKVCVEIAAMASDAGLIGVEDVVCVAGSARGADTCALVRPDASNRFFNIRVREIFAKPF